MRRLIREQHSLLCEALVDEGNAQVDVGRRVTPVQQRALATLDLILDTAAQMLEEVGADGLTTKALAARANIRVRSIYRYFPNKLAVIQAVAERVAERQKIVLQVATRRSDNDTPWRIALRRELGALVDSFGAEPGLAAVRKAMQTSPSLKQVHTEGNEEIARLWAGDLASRGMAGPPKRHLSVARTAVKIAAALLENFPRGDVEAGEAQFAELCLVLESYLANYLNSPES